MKRLVTVACLSILVVTSLFLALRSTPPAPLAPVIVMPQPYSIPRSRGALFERWVPSQLSWAWLWHLKETFQGRPKVCDLAAAVIDFTGSGDSFLTNFFMPEPEYADATGLRIWLLSEAKLSALRRDLGQTSGAELLYSPRIATADGMQARLIVGSAFPIMGIPTRVGLAVDFLPRVRPNGTDVTTIITLTEAITNSADATAGSSATGATVIQTNLEVAARVQIPKGSGALLLEGPSAAANHKRIGVILSVTTPKPKK
jgi:hypothetical protein